jgi:hypothetical protein
MAIRATSSLAAFLGLVAPAVADECRLALVLALDVSASVDQEEDHFQRRGLAQALVAPEVMQAFLSGAPVALYVFEWSGSLHQVTFPPGWQMVDSEADLIRIAASIASSTGDTDRSGRATAVGSALSYAATALKGGPDCWARTVDIAGDGASNEGAEPANIYGKHLLDGVTVNALIIGGAHVHSGRAHVPADDVTLAAWFEAEVLHGSGAFWILADGYADYERAMTLKLLRELQVPVMSSLAAVEGGATSF